MSCQLSWPPGHLRNFSCYTSLHGVWRTQTCLILNLESLSCTQCPPHCHLTAALQCSRSASSNSLQIAVPGLHAACPLLGRMLPHSTATPKAPVCRWVERAAAGETPNDRKMRRNLECILDGKRLVVYGELEWSMVNSGGLWRA